MVMILPDKSQPMTLPSFPDVPVAGPEEGVILPLKPDAQIPEEIEPVIQAFPTSISAQCTSLVLGATLVEKILLEDPMFSPAAKMM